MIKYYGKLRPLRVKRWSSCLALLSVSPFLMWFIILLLGLRLCQLYNSRPTPTHKRSPSVRNYSRECGACSTASPLSAICARNGAWITAAKPSAALNEWIFIYSHWYSCHPLKKSSFYDKCGLPYLTWHSSWWLLCLTQRRLSAADWWIRPLYFFQLRFS